MPVSFASGLPEADVCAAVPPQKQESQAGSPGLSFLSPVHLRGAAGSRLPAEMFFRAYITSARFSSSCCNTGRAQPAISTRPTASMAACGETP